MPEQVDRIKVIIQERRNVILLVALVAVLFLLIAFFISRARVATSPGSNTNTTQTSGPVTLQWWGVFLPKDVVQPLIDQYQTENPNVRIEYANVWEGGNRELASKLYQDKLDNVLKTNNPVEVPDIFMVENTWTGRYERYTTPAPADVITPQQVQSAFYPAVSQNFVANNQVRGLPLWMDALAIIYNRDLLTQAAVSSPESNWIDFRNLTNTLTVRGGSSITLAGFAAGTTKNTSFMPELLNLLLLQNGVTIASGGRASFASNVEGSRSAVDFLKAFSASGGSWDQSQKNDALAFLEGRVAMIAGPSWRYHDLLSLNKKNNLGINMGVATIPQLQGQNIPEINWATYWGNMVALNRPNSREAWKFLQWLTQPTQLRKLRTSHAATQDFFSFLYPRTDMATDLQADTYLRVFNAALPSAQSWYMGNGAQARSAFAELIDSAGAPANIQSAQSKMDQALNAKL